MGDNMGAQYALEMNWTDAEDVARRHVEDRLDDGYRLKPGVSLSDAVNEATTLILRDRMDPACITR